MNETLVQEVLKKTGMQKQALAAHLGVSRTTVSRWIKGRTPDELNQMRLREMLSGSPTAQIPVHSGGAVSAEVLAAKDAKIIGLLEEENARLKEENARLKEGRDVGGDPGFDRREVN